LTLIINVVKKGRRYLFRAAEQLIGDLIMMVNQDRKLSKLSSGDRDPSSELVSQLALLSKDPSSRILELENFWKQK
jgi:hypothetical protein